MSELTDLPGYRVDVEGDVFEEEPEEEIVDAGELDFSREIKPFVNSVTAFIDKERWLQASHEERLVEASKIFEVYFHFFEEESREAYRWISRDLTVANRFVNFAMWHDEHEATSGELRDLFFDSLVKRFGKRVKDSGWWEGTTIGVDLHSTIKGYWELDNPGSFCESQVKTMRWLMENGKFLDRLIERMDDEKMGFLIRTVGFINVAEEIRSKWQETGDKKYLEALRRVLGYEEIEDHYRKMGQLKDGEKLPMPSGLADVYKNVDFENYPPSIDEETRGMADFEKKLVEQGIQKDDRICVVGSGTGWEVDWLNRNGYINVLGVEIDEINIQKAKDVYPNAKFVHGSVENLQKVLYGPGGGYFQAVLMRGRTMTHLNHSLMQEAINQLSMVMDEKRGRFFVDLPDTSVLGGVYEEYLELQRQSLKKFGFSDKELRNINFIVDGPAARGRNEFWSKWLYTRFVPSEKWVVKQFWGQHFQKVDKYVEPIGNGTGYDKNINLVFEIRPYIFEEVEDDESDG